MRARLIVLCDNKPGPGDLLNAWGWSLFIEYNGRYILFDADTDPNVVKYNAKRLGVDLSKVEIVFLSHGHRDHYGGLQYIAEVRPGLKVYVPEYVPILESWGLRQEIIDRPREIAPGIRSTGPFSTPIGLKEHALVISLGDLGNLVVVGCSHPGIDVVVRKAREMYGDVYMVIGGFHQPSMNRLLEVLNMARFIAPAHCSGPEARQFVRNRAPDRFVDVWTGAVVEVPFAR